MTPAEPSRSRGDDPAAVFDETDPGAVDLAAFGLGAQLGDDFGDHRSVAAGSQRHERAGWNGPAPLPPLLAAGSNALAPNGRGKGRDRPRHRAALTPARADWR
jgi:hypothetical protein